MMAHPCFKKKMASHEQSATVTFLILVLVDMVLWLTLETTGPKSSQSPNPYSCLPRLLQCTQVLKCHQFHKRM